MDPTVLLQLERLPLGALVLLQRVQEVLRSWWVCLDTSEVLFHLFYFYWGPQSPSLLWVQLVTAQDGPCRDCGLGSSSQGWGVDAPTALGAALQVGSGKPRGFIKSGNLCYCICWVP